MSTKCFLLLCILQLAISLSHAAVRANPISEVEQHEAELPAQEGLSGFPKAFLSSISMILVSEIGDKTFFIAAIMAMRHNRLTVFLGAISALAIMTILSAILGMALPTLLPQSAVHWASTLLFLGFGVRLLREGYYADPDDENEELGEVEQELEEKEKRREDDVEKASKPSKSWCSKSLGTNTIFLQSLSMTFLAEWGDRSQIATIAMAAATEPIGVTLGGIIGHSICTGLAVLGGRALATRISERTITLLGGALFLLFGIHSAFFETA